MEEDGNFMKKTIIFFVLLLACVFSFAEEKITGFDVVMTVNKDSSANITESISVTVEGNKIRRGIYRDLPKSFNNAQVKYSAISLSRNGFTEPFFTENAGNDLRINFGDDSFLPRAPQDYVLKYTVTNTARFFNDYDEIYWNVTGNYWNFPIDKASFTLNLPEGAQVIENLISTYTGPAGSKGTMAIKHPRKLHFETTKPLAPHSGFTVAVPFKKGLLTAPKTPLTLELRINSPFVPPIAALIIAGIFFLLWRKYGKDNFAKIVKAAYEPPEDINPMQANYLWSAGMVSNSTLLSIALVDLSVKKAAIITKGRNPEGTPSFFTGEVREGLMAKPILWQEDKLKPQYQTIQRIIFEANQPLYFGEYDPQIPSIARALRGFVEHRIEKFVYKNGKIKFIASLLFLLFSFICVLNLVGGAINNLDNLLLCFLFGLCFGLAFLIVAYAMDPLMQSFVTKRKPPIIRTIMTAMFSAASAFMLFLICAVFADKMIALTSSIFIIFLTLAVGLFYAVVPKYSEAGTEAMNALNAFRLYLKTGEGGRIAASSAEEGAELFCKYLPYAIALNIENAWAKHFETLLDTKEAQTVMSEHGIYYISSGSAFNASSISSALSSAISHASTDPSSSSDGGGGSSGSGGGGSSGGGGGGGGGGGR